VDELPAGAAKSEPMNPVKLYIGIAGEGFKILPTVSYTFPTTRLLTDANTPPKVTVLPLIEQVKVLIDTESTDIDRQVTFDVSVNAEGNTSLTVALLDT
jgi:hypothetical protein